MSIEREATRCGLHLACLQTRFRPLPDIRLDRALGGCKAWPQSHESPSNRHECLGKLCVKRLNVKALTATHQQLEALAHWAKRWGTPDLVRRVRIAYSPRLRRSLGRVRLKSGIITLHAWLATAPQSTLLEVLCHEAAHVAAYLLHGSRAKPHGPEWRELVRIAGYEPVTRLHCPGLKVDDAPTRPLPPRKRCRCPDCGTDYFVRRIRSQDYCSVCLQQGLLVKLRPAPAA